MAIQLTVEAEDPEVECILGFLETQDYNSTGNKISALQRAILWLEASWEGHFRSDPRLPEASRLILGSLGSPAARSEDTLPLHRA